MDKTLFSSYEVGHNAHYFYVSGSSHSWLSSIVYHINCSRPSYQIADWSGLSTNLTRKVCSEEEMKDLENNTWKSVALRNYTSKYILQPMNNKNLHSNIWKLDVSFNGESLKNYTKYFSSYGDLVFSSDLI